MNFRKFRKSRKGLSPVIASIILIAVTVAVSVVVAAWMGGISLGFMNNAEQVTLSNPVFETSTVVDNVVTVDGTITVTARNSGASSVTISSGTIDGKAATLTSDPAATPITIGKGADLEITLDPTTLGDVTITSGAQYQIQLVTSKGTTIVYTATCP